MFLFLKSLEFIIRMIGGVRVIEVKLDLCVRYSGGFNQYQILISVQVGIKEILIGLGSIFGFKEFIVQ